MLKLEENKCTRKGEGNLKRDILIEYATSGWGISRLFVCIKCAEFVSKTGFVS